MRQHIDATLPSSTHPSKRKAHSLSNRFCISQNSRHANDATSLQGGIPHEPYRSTQTHRPNLSTHPKLLRNRTTLQNLPPTWAQVGQTLPTTRRTRTARPAQNPQTPTQKNRPRQTSASFSSTRKRATDADALPNTSPSKASLSPPTIRPILRRHAPATDRPRKQRRRFYPAHGAWEHQELLALIQADVRGALRAHFVETQGV